MKWASHCWILWLTTVGILTGKTLRTGMLSTGTLKPSRSRGSDSPTRCSSHSLGNSLRRMLSTWILTTDEASVDVASNWLSILSTHYHWCMHWWGTCVGSRSASELGCPHWSLWITDKWWVVAGAWGEPSWSTRSLKKTILTINFIRITIISFRLICLFLIKTKIQIYIS